MGLSSDQIGAVLSIDSAMNGCGASVYFPDNPGKSISQTLPMIRGQAEALVPMVQDIVNKAGIAFHDIDLIVSTRGPGTFTGLRVGLSAARSFALALDTPMVGVTTLETLMARARKDGRIKKSLDLIGVVIETKRNDFYFQLFKSDGQMLNAPAAVESSQIFDMLQDQSGILIGDAIERLKASFKNVLPSDFEFINGYDFPDPLLLAQHGYISIQNGNNYNNLEPLYLRGADVSVSKNKARILEAE